MALKFEDSGKLTHTPSSAITAGDIVILDGLVTIAPADIAANAAGTLVARGIHSGIAKTTSQVWTQGDRLYWDAANSKLTNVAANHVYAGRAAADAASAATTGEIALNAPHGGCNGLIAIPITIAGGAAADTDIIVRQDIRVIDVIAQHTGGAGEASDTLTLADGSDNAISDALDWSGADKAVVRAGTIDDAYATLAPGDTLRVTTVDSDSGADVGAGIVTVLAIIL